MTLWIKCPDCKSKIGIKGHITFGYISKTELAKKICGCHSRKEIQLKCPECESNKIDQYRMQTGAMWCSDCGFRVESKESNNPFLRYKE